MYAPVIATTLCAEGWEVVAVASTPWLRGMTDEHLLAYAAAEERLVVTENIADFAILAKQWAVELRVHAGLVFTNPRRFNRANVALPRRLGHRAWGVSREPPSHLGVGDLVALCIQTIRVQSTLVRTRGSAQPGGPASMIRPCRNSRRIRVSIRG